MAYVTKQELIDRFGQDEMPELDGGGDDDAKITAAITDADGIINLHLRTGGYTAPARGQAVVEIKRYAVRIVRYLMNEDTSSMSDEIQARYDEGMGWLKQVSKGDVLLTCEDPSPKMGSVSVRRT